MVMAAIKKETMESVITYLSTKPYREVSGLIQKIRDELQVIDLPEKQPQTVSVPASAD